MSLPERKTFYWKVKYWVTGSRPMKVPVHFSVKKWQIKSQKPFDTNFTRVWSNRICPTTVATSLLPQLSSQKIEICRKLCPAQAISCEPHCGHPSAEEKAQRPAAACQHYIHITTKHTTNLTIHLITSVCPSSKYKQWKLATFTHHSFKGLATNVVTWILCAYGFLFFQLHLRMRIQLLLTEI